jgi:MFS transporter, MHS family, shikimate and dehydroshikimate transport protein
VQQLGPILGGGLSPLIATALLAEYGSPFPVAAYMVAMALFSAACAYGLRPVRTD